MSRGPSRIYNIVSVVFLLLTLLVVIFVIVRLMGPPL
jgi:capsule polysaccharide export protein KpsE/RkpR